MKVILGSSSKWRCDVLEGLGFEVEVRKPDVDETAIRRDDPAELTKALAHAKCEKLLETISEPAVLVTAATVVVVEGKVREKPASPEEARSFLKSSSHQPVQVVTSVVVQNTQTGIRAEGTEITVVTFRPIDDKTIDALIEQGEVMYCCGAIRAEHPLMQPFVLQLDGTVENMMGMPGELTKKLIERVR